MRARLQRNSWDCEAGSRQVASKPGEKVGTLLSNRIPDLFFPLGGFKHHLGQLNVSPLVAVTFSNIEATRKSLEEARLAGPLRQVSC